MAQPQSSSKSGKPKQQLTEVRANVVYIQILMSPIHDFSLKMPK